MTSVENAASALKRSKFKPSTTFPNRWLYVLPNGKHLSVELDSFDPKTGEWKTRDGGTDADGGSEAFLLDGNVASLDPGDDKPMAPTYLVNNAL